MHLIQKIKEKIKKDKNIKKYVDIKFKRCYNKNSLGVNLTNIINNPRQLSGRAFGC